MRGFCVLPESDRTYSMTSASFLPARDDLPASHPINRAARIARLVLVDAKQAISCHACFFAANEEVRTLSTDGGPVVFADAETFNVAHFALLSHLSLLLARLFDPGRPGTALSKTDVASIPILMRLLAIEEVRDHLIAEARRWTPHLDRMEEIHAACVEEGVRDVLAAWDAFQGTPEGTRILDDHKRFRNQVLAHTLDITKGALPIVNDVYRLVEALISLVRSVALIFYGEDWEAAQRHRIGLNQGKLFWRRALKANYDAMREWT